MKSDFFKLGSKISLYRVKNEEQSSALKTVTLIPKETKRSNMFKQRVKNTNGFTSCAAARFTFSNVVLSEL